MSNFILHQQKSGMSYLSFCRASSLDGQILVNEEGRMEFLQRNIRYSISGPWVFIFLFS